MSTMMSWYFVSVCSHEIQKKKLLRNTYIVASRMWVTKEEFEEDGYSILCAAQFAGQRKSTCWGTCFLNSQVLCQKRHMQFECLAEMSHVHLVAGTRKPSDF